MDYYRLAKEEIQAIKTLFDAGQYRHAITHTCLCIEYLLKTKLVQIAPTSHNRNRVRIWVRQPHHNRRDRVLGG